jgi:hypothetical protein
MRSGQVMIGKVRIGKGRFGKARSGQPVQARSGQVIIG